MNISELVDVLTKAKERYGDMPVYGQLHGDKNIAKVLVLDENDCVIVNGCKPACVFLE